jgi:nucleotidyltransferase/DNA polymerase involved in DNA repair
MDPDNLKNLRVIAHIDLDAFYAQVEQNLNPRLKGSSVAVIQVR